MVAQFLPSIPGLRKVLASYSALGAEASSRPKTMGLGAVAGYGANNSSLAPGRGVHNVAIVMRARLLSSFFHRGVLREYLLGDTLNPAVFQVAATMPCDKAELGEALVLLHLAQSPEDVRSKATQELKREGYDPKSPNIDSKFLRSISSELLPPKT